MSLIKLWHKKNGSHQTKKYFLPLFTALSTVALFFTGCANSAESSSKSSAEKISVTVKTEADISSARSILPSLSGTFRLSFKEKGASDSTYKLADGGYPDYQMIIIPGEYTFRLESVISEEDSTVILTGETDFTVESGMENVTICFMLSSPEGATGNGSVSLFLSADTDTKIETFSVSAVGTEGESSFSWSKNEEETSYLKGTLSCTSLAPGTYTLVITGLNSLNEPVYVRHEVLTVWSNVVSGRWIFANGSSSNELKITASDLYSTYYVKGSSGPYNFYTDGVFGDVTASDTNSGNITSPLQTVSAAVNKCVVSGKPYTIYVDGTVKESKFTTNDPTAISIPVGKQITIKSLNSEGETKAVIQADGKGRVMFAGGTVILENLEFKGGTDSKYGGGIFVSSTGALTMKNCTITGCNATTSGGGLYIASNGSANLSGCTISSCRCIGGGGGLYIASGVTATLIGCTIQANYTRDSTGAGSGGGILNSGTLNITDCKFISNNANCGGGIQTVGGGTVTITGTGEDTCVFQSNKANSGGAIHTLGTVTAENVKFESNSSGVSNGGGGGLWIEGSSSNVTLTDCNLSNNTAANLGGAVWVSGGSLTMDGCTVSGNTASNGGGIYLNDGALTISSTTMENNKATAESTDPSAGVGGGAIYSRISITLTDCTFLSNKSSKGKAIRFNPKDSNQKIKFNGKIQTNEDDIYFNDGRRFVIQTPLSPDSSILVTPYPCTPGQTILNVEEGVTLADQVDYFNVTPQVNGSAETQYVVNFNGKILYFQEIEQLDKKPQDNTLVSISTAEGFNKVITWLNTNDLKYITLLLENDLELGIQIPSNFAGTLNGNGHTITGTNPSYTTLFASSSANFINLNVGGSYTAVKPET